MGADEQDWLAEYDDLPAEDLEFVRAIDRPGWFDLWHWPDDDLVVTLSVVDPSPGGPLLLTAGVRYRPGSIVADLVDHQDLSPADPPSPLRTEASGDVAALAAVARSWFDDVVSRAVHVDEWLHDGVVYATVHRVEGIGDVTMGYRDHLAPAGLTQRLLDAGSYQGRGWIRPRGIGAPDRTRVVRG